MEIGSNIGQHSVCAFRCGGYCLRKPPNTRRQEKWPENVLSSPGLRAELAAQPHWHLPSRAPVWFSPHGAERSWSVSLPTVRRSVAVRLPCRPTSLTPTPYNGLPARLKKSSEASTSGSTTPGRVYSEPIRKRTLPCTAGQSRSICLER